MTIVATAIMGGGGPPLFVDAGANVEATDSGFAACGAVGPTPTPGAVVTGGKTPYVFAWTQIGTPAQNGPYTPNSASIQNPTWSDPSVCDGDVPDTETWQLEVTDDDLNVENDTILVRLVWTNLS